MKPQPHIRSTDPRKQKAAKALSNNKPADAARILKQFCKNNPGDTDALLMLASAHGQCGNFNGVVKACERVLKMQPDTPPALSLLGNAQASLDRHQEAEAAYRRALALSPRDASIHNNLGHALALTGKTDEAIEYLRKAVELNPKHADAHHNLAKLLQSEGALEEAIEHFGTASDLRPDRVETLILLGDSLTARGKLEMAEAVFKRARELDPENFLPCRGLASTYRFQGRFQEAMDVCAPFGADGAGHPLIAALEAQLCELTGDVPQAHDRVSRLIEQGQDTATAATVLLRTCRKMGGCDQAITLAEGMLSDPSLPPAERQLLHFGLGELHDRLGSYDAAFEQYYRANEMSSLRYDHEAQQALFSRIIQVFDPEQLPRLPRSSNGSERPVFIVGMPRSGTTLCEQIIASHPDAAGAGELAEMSHLASCVPGYPRAEAVHTQRALGIDEKKLDELAQRYLRRLDDFSTTEIRTTDKMPHNFQHLGLIRLLFPRARIIHCVRDPIDTCLSIYFQNFNATHPYATDLRNLGLYYQEYQRLMRHWEEVLDVPVMTVRYEELVNDQERVTRALVDFLGLPWDDRCLRFHEADRNVATASYDQVRQKLYTKSLARWKNYERHIGPLREALGL